MQVSDLSKIVYVSLRNDRDSIILDHKLKLTDGLAHGFFFIPTSLETGIYQLLCFSHFSLNNQKESVASKDIYVINPFKKYRQQAGSGQVIEISSRKISELTLPVIDLTNGYDLETNQPSYRQRERIKLNISSPKNQPGSGHFTLSIRRIPPVQVLPANRSGSTYEAKRKDLFFVPEFRGELIAGQLVAHHDTTAIADRTVALSLPGSRYILKLARTNHDGRFLISIDEPYQTSEGIVQVIGPDRSQIAIEFHEKEISANNRATDRSLKLNPDLGAWLEERSVQVQIQNAYFKQENITTFQEAPAKPFYGSHGREFILDDYTRFPSVKETFVEVISLARIRKKQGKEVFEVFDPNDPYKTGPFSNLDPLVLLDGIFIQDASEITRMNAFELDRIHVIPEPYRYGPRLFRGIIDIKTKNGGGQTVEPQQEFELNRPVSIRSYKFPTYEEQSYDRIPDQRVQLLWKPNLQLTDTSHVEVFYASDLPGTYEIVLEGYTSAGVYTKAMQSFSVK